MPKPDSIPACPSKPTPPPAVPPVTIHVVTPLVGGGALPGEIDPAFPVRPTSIRGNLRHWWRLTVGQALGEGMFQREEELFGSAEFASPTTVEVSGATRAETFDPADRQQVEPFGPVAYALFPSIENGHRVAREGVRFELVIRTPTAADLARRRAAQNDRRRKAKQPPLPPTIAPIDGDVTAALRAWLAYGGLGGRTRRGCGAVHAPALAGPPPAIPGRVFVGPPQPTTVAAWREALQAYRDFRQTPRGRRHPKTLKSGKTVQVPGRSHWPEADSLRRLTGCSLKPPPGAGPSGVPADEDPHDHSTPVVPAAALPSFPKAVLGLPINFHFADGPGKNRPAAANLDPQDVQLYPLLPAGPGKWAKAERMASPVVTRPLWLGGRWHPAVVILDGGLPPGVMLRVEGKRAALRGDLSADVPPDQIAHPRLAAAAPMRGKASALDALVEYLTRDLKWGTP